MTVRDWSETQDDKCCYQPLETDRSERYFNDLFVASVASGSTYSNGVTISPDGIAFSDVYYDFGKNTLAERICAGPNLPRPKSVDGNLAAIATPGAERYFHFLFDALPRIGLLQGWKVDHFYVQSDQSYQAEYLELLGISAEQIVPAKALTHFRADQLLVPSFPGRVGYVTRRTCCFLRRLLTQVGSPVRESTCKIYISRSDATRRRVTNESEVWNCLRGYGFDKVRLADMKVAEQIRLFARASVVVGPHGAGLSNLVYSHPGTQVIELFSPKYVNECFEHLAGQCRLNYHSLVGVGSRPTEKKPRREKQNMRIDVRSLAETIESILSRRMALPGALPGRSVRSSSEIRCHVQ